MRVHKYRAWDGSIMFEPAYIDEFGNAYASLHDVNETNHHNLHKNAALMQYTGLSDENGKEVYEGDILNWLTLSFPITVDETHGYRFMYGLDQLTAENAIHGEVIGNIYETSK